MAKQQETLAYLKDNKLKKTAFLITDKGFLQINKKKINVSRKKDSLKKNKWGKSPVQL